MAKRLDESRWNLAWKYRPPPRPRCVTCGPSFPQRDTAAPHFSAHVYCGPFGWMDQGATWYGVGLSLGHVELDWEPSPPKRGSEAPPIFGPRLLWPNGRPSQLLLSTCFEDLPGPNMAWLLGVYVVAPRPLLSLYGIIYVTWYTSDLPGPTGVRLR